MHVWDGDKKKRVCQFSKYPTSISSLAFSPDGSRLVVSGGLPRPPPSLPLYQGRRIPSHRADCFALVIPMRAASYTWENGAKDHPPDAIYVRNVKDADVKPKSK